MIKAVIFDMDGTLADSMSMHFEIWQRVLAEKGVDVSYDDYRPFIGHIGVVFVDHLNKTRDLSLDAQSLRTYKKSIIEKIYHERIKIFPYAKDLIQSLKDDGYRLAIASSEWRDHVEEFIKKNDLAGMFELILGLEDIDKHKPAPDVYLKTAKKLGVKPSECVVFEDSFAGLMSAKSAGMVCITLANSLSKEEMKESDLVINNYKEKDRIREFISRLQ